MKRISRRGFTLIEMMAVTAIVGTVMIPLARLLPNVMWFFQRPNIETGMAMAADPALNNMLHFLRDAQAQSVAIATPAGQPLYSELSFKTLNTNGAAGTGHRYDFAQNGTLLQMSVDGGTPQTLASDVQFISFSLPQGASDPYTLVITLELQSAARNAPNQFFLQRQVRLVPA